MSRKLRKWFSGFAIVLNLLAVGCGKSCPKPEYRDYKYLETALVTAGFYEGYNVKIIGRKLYAHKSCIVPHFKVKIDYHPKHGFFGKEAVKKSQKNTQEVYIPQYYLHVQRYSN
jgi:hypothetical protein